ncbi:MAG TPA: DUF5777 family beta-barrel protein [Edaphocola sp.]|nr:DUF5777 family beta-barrel protein [Edaphocola sp.]
MRCGFLPALSCFLLMSFYMPAVLHAQDNPHADSLMAQLDEALSVKQGHIPVSSTFKATRIGNTQSVKNVGRGVLDFEVSHRFGTLNQGFHSFFGLDNAVTKLNFDYGLTDWLTIGAGRSTYEKQYDGMLKLRLLQQTTDDHMPVSLSYVGAFYVQSMDMPDMPNGDAYLFTNRITYLNQLLIARKFNRLISLQLMLTHLHFNIVPTTVEPNNVYAAGLGGRIKISNRMALIGEYHYQLPEHKLEGFHNSLSVGLAIETGGHVFQLLFSNSAAINMPVAIGKSADSWAHGGIHFGFNLSRVFTVARPKS